MASFVGEMAPSPTEDTAIRERLITELEKQPWAPLTMIDVVVRNGVVQFSGTVTDDRQRQAVLVAAESISGVKRVEGHIVWVDPVSGFYIDMSPEEEHVQSPRKS
jgi:osmotically-inducible protein OsmY